MERSATENAFARRLDETEDLSLKLCPINFTVSVVLPAAGSGERTGLPLPKQYCKILGRPLISLTIHAFERVSWIQHIVVVIAKEHFEIMTDILHKYNHTKVSIVEGGPTRHRSIFNGLLAFDKQTIDNKLQKPNVVIIHDAVRPLVEEDFLLKISLAANSHGASGAVRQLVSTVVAASPTGRLEHSLERSRYRASEMPQGFTYDVIFQAYQQCSEADFEFGTECLALVLQHCGIRAALIEGPVTLWKVTYNQDFTFIEASIKESLSKSACIIAEDIDELQTVSKGLRNYLTDTGMTVETVLKTESNITDTANRNFIKIALKGPDLDQIQQFLRHCEECKDLTLYPVTVIWIYLNMSERIICKEESEEYSTMNVGRDAMKRNIFLYCIRIHNSEATTQCKRTMDRLCHLTLGLIQERSAAFVGQTLLV